MIKKQCFTLMAMAFVAMAMVSCGDDVSSYIPPAVHPRGSNNTDTTATDKLAWEPHVDGQPYNTYRGLIMCGYQGWFGTPDDGSQLTKNEKCYYHYQEHGQFRPGVMRNSIDFWPDMSEYEKKYTVEENETYHSSPFILPDGSKAQVYSPYDKSSVMLHFKWMQQYGIDGVFMQRFVGEVCNNPSHKEHFDKVLDNAMEASNTYQRAISVMYDLSGTNKTGWEYMVKDAQAIMDKYNLKDRTKQKFYLYENEKPLLALWGIGFNDSSHPSAAKIKEYVAQLKAQGWSIMLGCPAYWREGGNDATPGVDHGELLSLIKSCDAFMPWYVGRYDYNNFSGWADRISQDIKWAKDNKVVYAVHVYPGGSDRNMHPNNALDQETDYTGFRYGGKFYWQQLSYDIKAGAEAIYVGMFDEMDEGTAIFKQLNVSKAPSNVYDGPDYWVTYFSNGSYDISDAEQSANNVTWSRLASSLNVRFQGIDDNLPTDHYLWLTGQAALMLNKKIAYTAEMPTR